MILKNARYTCDENFTTVYAGNRIYTIARNTGDYGSVAVGERMAMGDVLTQELYDKWSSECATISAFELTEAE